MTTLLLGTETALLIVVLIIVVGLLRAYAELLHRTESGHSSSLPIGSSFQEGAGSAHGIRGLTLAGETLEWSPTPEARTTLLAFLSSGCGSCGEFWESFNDDATLGGLLESLLIVTKDGDEESLSRLLSLSGRHQDVVMSTKAWRDYRVPGSPYFVLVDNISQSILGEGTGNSLGQVASLLRDALADQELSRLARTPSWKGDAIEEHFARMGITAGHPSLTDNTT